MPRFYCDYCDAYLTHDSMSGRQQHMRGWKHRENFKLYYQQFYPQWMEQQQLLQMQMMQSQHSNIQMQQQGFMQQPNTGFPPFAPNFDPSQGPNPSHMPPNGMPPTGPMPLFRAPPSAPPNSLPQY